MVNSWVQDPATVASKWVNGARSQLSVAVGLPTAFGRVEASQLTVMGAGQVITGFSMSLTVTVKVQVAELPS